VKSSRFDIDDGTTDSDLQLAATLETVGVI